MDAELKQRYERVYHNAVFFPTFEDAFRFYKWAKAGQMRELQPYQDCFLCTVDRATMETRIRRYLEATGTMELKEVKERLNLELRTQSGAKRFLQTQAAGGQFASQLQQKLK